MKYLIIFLFISTFTKSNCIDITGYARDCSTKLGLKNNVLQDGLDKQSKGIDPPHAYKCLSKCIGQRSGYITGDQINKAAVLRDLPAGVSIDFKKCQKITGSDDCDKYYKTSECIKKQLPKNI